MRQRSDRTHQRLSKWWVLLATLLIASMCTLVVTDAANAQTQLEIRAEDDAAFTEGERIDIDVIENDIIHEDATSIDLTITEEPTSGDVTVRAGGAPFLRFKPDDGFGGVTTMSYEICVDGICDTGTVDVYVGSSSCTIAGTSDADTLTGTPGDDVICGLRGNDNINGGDGNDLIFGGRGDDTIDGGDGDDEIHGGKGDDTISGETGSDLLRGGKGNDTIDGGDGADLIIGGRADDVLTGASGNDKIRGYRGNDSIDGGSGDDDLEGGRGNDVLAGGEGDDELRGRRGDDILDGGVDTDLLEGGRGDDQCANGETYESCETIDDPVFTGDFTVLSPAPNATISSMLVVTVEYDDTSGIERIDILIDGEQVGEIAPTNRLGIADLAGTASGPITLELIATLTNGETSIQTVDVNVRGDLTDIDSVGDAFDAGELSVDDYLLTVLPLASSESGTTDALDDDPTESTMVVFGLLLKHLSDVTPQTRAALDRMAQVVDEPIAGAQLQALQRADYDCGRRIWVFGMINDPFCEYRRAPADPSNSTVRWLVKPSILFDASGQDTYTATLDTATDLIWAAETRYESYGFELPDTHRVDGTPLTVFVTDGSDPAYSSPYYEGAFGEDYGHPIRVRDTHLTTTIVHELFHTFEWSSINWDNDVVLARSSGRTVAAYESAANWATQEHFADAGPIGYNASRVRKAWFNDPTQTFMDYSDFLPSKIVAGDQAYSFFPGLVWLDENAGNGPITGDSGGFVLDFIRAYEDFDLLFGNDPWDIIQGVVSDGPQAHDGKPLARAWPRMWAALYLLKSPSDISAAEQSFYQANPWAVFEKSETAQWRSSFENFDPILSDSYGYGRPARAALVDVAHPSVNTMPEVEISPGGAAFYDFNMPAGHGTVKFTVEHDRGGDHDRFEVIAFQFDDTNRLVVCERQLVMSDPDIDAKTVTGTLEYSPGCNKITVGVVHVNLDTGIFDPGDNGATEKFVVTLETVDQFAPPVLPTSLLDMSSGSSYATSLIESVDTDEFVFTVNNTTGIPDGLTIDEDTAKIIGTPAFGSVATINATLEDAFGRSVTGTIQLTVNGPKLTSAGLVDGEVGDLYSAGLFPFTELGPDGAGIADYSVTEFSLPAGLTLGPSTGVLSGTPTAPGRYPFVVTATNDNGASSSAQYEIDVADAPSTNPVADLAVLNFPSEIRIYERFSYDVRVTNQGPGTIAGGVLTELVIDAEPSLQGVALSNLPINMSQGSIATITVSGYLTSSGPAIFEHVLLTRDPVAGVQVHGVAPEATVNVIDRQQVSIEILDLPAIATEDEVTTWSVRITNLGPGTIGIDETNVRFRVASRPSAAICCGGLSVTELSLPIAEGESQILTISTPLREAEPGIAIDHEFQSQVPVEVAPGVFSSASIQHGFASQLIDVVAP